jgi:hypothetical protein
VLANGRILPISEGRFCALEQYVPQDTKPPNFGERR